MMTYEATYCPRCGIELDTRHVDGRDRKYCEGCDRVEWRNPVPGAGVAVVDPDRGVLLAQRAIEPGVGEWVVPGGYMEVEETPAVAGTRELEEETGVRVDPDAVELLGTFTATPFDGKHVVSVGYAVHARHATGTPHAGHEVQAVGWFTPEEFAASDHVFHDPHDERFERAWTHVTGE
ncbi:NUDIX hydrolase [Halorubellus salinus]|uniref:NUDIX hydrolase n=1 Tax=Halorubellus salinus TaxID=755309 RepID=UPI001D091FCB|nr:NUDIX domain-containing protein [Halorubellus salinus]